MYKQKNAIVALTDYNWYNCLRDYSNINIVNFWTPTPWNIKNLKVGGYVFFLLKARFGRKICGYGEFIRYENSTVSTAWNTFGKQNGVDSLEEFNDRIRKYTNKNSNSGFKGIEHIIGCVILENLVFFDLNNLKETRDFGWVIPNQVVKFKSVDYNGIPTFIANEPSDFTLIKDKVKYRNTTSKERVGQSKFRNDIMNAYGKKCCITGETTSEILEAAHIQEYISEESNHIQNGLLLRADLHKLFDAGLITINDEYKIQVSRFLDSSNYQSLDGKKINLPDTGLPSLEALKWHNTNLFRY